MIYSTYVGPTERPTSSLDIKRALLTYDRICLPDPSDRDLFPPQSFMVALGMPPVFSVPIRRVRTLGKMPEYDNEFDRLMEELQYARRQGLIDVISTYDQTTTSKFTIGAVLMGGYPLNPQFMLRAYRSIARDNEVLLAAIRHDNDLLDSPEEYISAIAEPKAAADGSINDDPHLPELDGELNRAHLRESYSIIARSRISSVLKSIGFCAAKQMVPIFSERSYCEIASSMASRARRVIDAASIFDPNWSSRSQALRIAHEEYIDETVLSQMSIDDVLKLRTVAWGQQAEARDSLLESIAKLAREAERTFDFESTVRDRLIEYRKAHTEIQNERRSLNFQIKCDVTKLIVGSAFSVATGPAITGLLTQVQTAIGAATLLTAGCLYTLEKIRDYRPVLDQLRSAEREFNDNACLGLHNFYGQLERSAGGS
jgi:hypothetical protein